MIMSIVLGALHMAFAIVALMAASCSNPDIVDDPAAITRAALLDFIGKYDGQGVARRYRWVADGELGNPSIWIYQVL